MKDFGTVKSAVRPEPMVVDDYSVWIHTDIQEINTPGMDGKPESCFEYHMIRYDKNEYIHKMVNHSDSLETELTNTQMALCDVYELLEGG